MLSLIRDWWGDTTKRLEQFLYAGGPGFETLRDLHTPLEVILKQCARGNPHPIRCGPQTKTNKQTKSYYGTGGGGEFFEPHLVTA